ncbi:glycosyltransferase [Nonomuraea sp. MG754425]|uniref:glycosyltransferase n=1 Tax=Nonomuraea sp. MG754425 TaxID=2570319 RepID=UPI001F1948CA|nr:glycosyltransferase [Nonomuraea sp. MG754425]
MTQSPQLSVIIPTYNRARPLWRTLEALARQRMPLDDVEVVVADDGSSDATREVVTSFTGRIPLRYHFQPDLGFRAGAARNEGARLAAAPVLAFLDTGILVGPDFARTHLEAHRSADLVIGYTLGYDPAAARVDWAALADELLPEQLMARLRDEPYFQDVRHAALARTKFAMDRLAAPWFFTWTANLSVKAEHFWAVGAFDEEFRGWGLEDLELGYRLVRAGARVGLSRQAWGIESTHEHDPAGKAASSLQNVHRFVTKHQHPLLELFAALYTRKIGSLEEEYWSVEEWYRELIAWTRQVGALDVRDELARASEGGPGRIAVFGSGRSAPQDWPGSCALVEFDLGALEACADGRYHRVHGVGLRTPFADRSFDLVIISSRMRGLWDTWRTQLLAEAHRIGRKVRVTFAA